jgi:hypothetical protein
MTLDTTLRISAGQMPPLIDTQSWSWPVKLRLVADRSGQVFIDATSFPDAHRSPAAGAWVTVASATVDAFEGMVDGPFTAVRLRVGYAGGVAHFSSAP